MHNGFLQVEGEKMSKSLGNFVIIRDLLADWPGEVLRLNMLKTHYRQPIDWTVKGLEESARTLEQWFDAAAPDAHPRPAAAVLEALADDLNTPKAIAEMHALKDHAGKKALAGTLAFLGFEPGPLREWTAARAPELSIAEAEIEARIAERIEARRNRDWAASDRIRDELMALGVALKDNKDGTTTWEPKR
jgi:cysteinyl-tRNA synthetase